MRVKKVDFQMRVSACKCSVLCIVRGFYKRSLRRKVKVGRRVLKPFAFPVKLWLTPTFLEELDGCPQVLGAFGADGRSQLPGVSLDAQQMALRQRLPQAFPDVEQLLRAELVGK